MQPPPPLPSRAKCRGKGFQILAMHGDRGPRNYPDSIIPRLICRYEENEDADRILENKENQLAQEID